MSTDQMDQMARSLLVHGDGELHPCFIVSRKMARKLKRLPLHGLIERIIKRFRLSRGHIIEHVESSMMHLVHRHMLHVHPQRHDHKFVGDFASIGDREVIGLPAEKVVTEDVILYSDRLTCTF